MGYESKYIVSDNHKFVYFVVPKVACSSIKTALLPLFYLNTGGYETPTTDGALGLDVHKLHKFFDESGHQINKERLIEELNGEYREHFKFAFVRNPWDRLVSCYFNKVMDVKKTALGKLTLRSPGQKDPKIYRGMPFAEFVEAVHTIPDSKANRHFGSQHQVICGPGRDKPIMVDFVGRFENLVADFEIVAERIGAQKLQLPHILRSTSRKSRPYTELYDTRLKNLVYERYQEDIEIFNYSFGDPHSPPPLWRRDGRAGSRLLKQESREVKKAEPQPEPDGSQDLALQQKVKELEHNLARESREVMRLNRRLKRLNRQLEDLQSSRTWKLLNKLNRIRTKLSAK